MKKYMNFKYVNGQCEISYSIKGLSILIRGRGISETAKEVARMTNNLFNINTL